MTLKERLQFDLPILKNTKHIRRYLFNTNNRFLRATLATLEGRMKFDDETTELLKQVAYHRLRLQNDALRRFRIAGHKIVLPEQIESLK